MEWWLGAIIGLALGVALGGLGGYFIFSKLQGDKVGRTKTASAKIVEEAQEEARRIKKEAIVEARDEVHRLRGDFDRENRERREEIKRTEQRIAQKEEILNKKDEQVDRKLENLEQTRKNLQDKEAVIAKDEADLAASKSKMLDELQKVASMTKEEAKRALIEGVENEARKDAAILAREIENSAREEADKKAKEIICAAIQKSAADYTAEVTVSVVSLPNDEVKGRIIGREGRNIRALEAAVGVDLIVDDTPEAVVVSGFDPVRREIARVTLEKLIADGRIHPARIEETVEKVKREIENGMRKAGEDAMYETGVFNLHPELVKTLGRLKYRTSYGQNVLQHSIEVSHLAGSMAAELGVDATTAKRAGLLHDIGKAIDRETEGTHTSIGVDLAKKYKENNAVVHGIAAHHNDVAPTTLEAVLVQAADAVSSARPGARRESLENYVKRLEKLEEVANAFPGVEKSFAISAGREIRIIVKPDKVDDAAAVLMAKDIAKKIEGEMDYPGQIKVNVIRETRTVEYAK